MTTRTAKSTNTEEIAAIEDLLSDLEKRLQRLSGATKREVSGASSDVSDFVSEALSGIMDRMRDKTTNVGQAIGDQATRIGSEAIKTVVDEIEQRPLIMLAVAAGVGYLVGVASRR
jgi:ElaB/YqjD/DUF883 family membrane-anchored ribosome-binding protein